MISSVEIVLLSSLLSLFGVELYFFEFCEGPRKYIHFHPQMTKMNIVAQALRFLLSVNSKVRLEYF